jgi:hypothetical protein
MSFPKITINNNKDEMSNNHNNIKIKIIKPNNKNQSIQMVDNFTSTNSLDYNNSNNQKLYPIKIKKYNIILPALANKKNHRSNINKSKNIDIISKSIKNRLKDIKMIKKTVKNVYNFYHPWINNSCNDKEINEFMSNCYDITKIDAPTKDNKNRINESKLTNQLLKDVVEKRYKIANIFQKTKLNNIKFNDLNIRNKLNVLDTKTNRFIKDKKSTNNFILNEYNDFKTYKPNHNINKSHSLENTYLSLSKKNLRKNETLFIKDYSISLQKLPKLYPSLNTSYSRNNIMNEDFNDIILSQRSANNVNNSLLKNDYKTIKIKKIVKNSKNDKNYEEKTNRIEKIKSNLLFKKNITNSSLFPENETHRTINKSNLIKCPLKIWFKYSNN